MHDLHAPGLVVAVPLIVEEVLAVRLAGGASCGSDLAGLAFSVARQAFARFLICILRYLDANFDTLSCLKVSRFAREADVIG